MRNVAVHPGGMAHHRIETPLRMWEFVREFFHKCQLSLSSADRALKEAKTLELLQDRLIGSNGIKDLQVDQSRLERDKRVVRVYVLSSRVLTEHEKTFVHATVDEVNRRFGTHMFAFISVPRQK